MTEHNCKQLLIRVPEELYEAIRRAAFESKRSMTDIVNEAIRQWICQEQRSK
jgi:hypothetical protein